ncbi:MAG TPA: AraC family transcriptional regulator [Puia sp.]|nr:AraC family transcriptional regulator [Puia sp.]
MSAIFTIPQDLFAEGCPVPLEKTAIRIYESSHASIKSRVSMQKNLFSFLLEGEKAVHRPGEPLRIHAGQFLLIAGGNCLMTEKLSVNNRYHSLLFFFDDSVLKDFFTKYPTLPERTQRLIGCGQEPVVSFESDDFIRNYLHSLQLLLHASPFLKEELQILKFEELLLYLVGKYPESLFSFRLSDQSDAGDRQLLAAVEGNLHHAITVEELAFLCNMSLSTFKRRFARVYGTSPNKWLLQKRMEQAALLLNRNAKPSEVYHRVGYENHSSFTQSFKQVYGVTPREYQQKAGMNV